MNSEDGLPSWRAVGIAICEALKLNPRTVKSVTIRIDAHKQPMVEVEHYLARLDEQRELPAVISHYELVPRVVEDTTIGDRAQHFQLSAQP